MIKQALDLSIWKPSFKVLSGSSTALGMTKYRGNISQFQLPCYKIFPGLPISVCDWSDVGDILYVTKTFHFEYTSPTLIQPLLESLRTDDLNEAFSKS